MKPKILNDLTNIFAKLAGSRDYDPSVKYNTALEYYANQVPVIPKPGAGDNGKFVSAKDDGTYELSDFDVDAFVIKPNVVDVEETEAVIKPADNTIYNCAKLVSLTISDPPATGKYVIVFYSGAIATTTVGIENFVAEANKRYKITVEDNYATYDSWPYTPT